MPRVSSVAKTDLEISDWQQGPKPAPPKALSEPEAQHWQAIVARMPDNWFTVEMQPMLRNLCAHIAASHVIEYQLREFDERLLETKLGLEHYAGLSKVHALHTNMIATISTKLRLTPQSRYDRLTAGSAARRAAQEIKQPWDVARAAA